MQSKLMPWPILVGIVLVDLAGLLIAVFSEAAVLRAFGALWFALLTFVLGFNWMSGKRRR